MTLERPEDPVAWRKALVRVDRGTQAIDELDGVKVQYGLVSGRPVVVNGWIRVSERRTVNGLYVWTPRDFPERMVVEVRPIGEA